MNDALALIEIGGWAAAMVVLQCILADFELVSRPPEGCAPRTGQPATDKLEQVVFAVLHELQKRGIF